MADMNKLLGQLLGSVAAGGFAGGLAGGALRRTARCPGKPDHFSED